MKAGREYALETLESRKLLSIAFQLNTFDPLAPSTDVNVSALAGDETEPAIAIDPSNPARMFASANHGLHGNGLFAAYSGDAGASWTRTDVSDGIIAQGSGGDLPLACCNSSVAFDRFGNLYLSYLEANTGKVVLAISSDGGRTFGSVRHLGGTHSDTDQPTVITGPGSNGAAASVWILYANHQVDSGSGFDTQNMAVQGAAVSGPGAANVGAFGGVQLVPDVAGVAQNFGDVAVGPAGQLVVAFQDDRSANGPVNVYVSEDSDGLGSGGFSTPVLVGSTNVGGDDAIAAQSDMKIDAAIGLAYDLSDGVHRGRLYMVFSDEAINESDDIDTLVRYSDDDGASWSGPVLVNDDGSGRSQFLPRIAVDPSSGFVGVSWYDARNDPQNAHVQVYAAVSGDGGESFEENVLVSDGMSFHRAGWPLDYGGYAGLAFFGGMLVPIWADDSVALNNFEVYADRVVVREEIAVNGSVSVSEVGGNFLKIVEGGVVKYGSEAGSVLNVESGEVGIDSDLRLAGLKMAKVDGIYLGKLDLKDHELKLSSGSAAELEDMVKHGRNEGGYWVGNGISSSVAAADVRRVTGIGVVERSDGVLVKYSWNGDADLDGDVDGDDYARIDAGYAGHLSGYGNGDFNYSGGSPNADDYFLIDRAFGEQGTGLMVKASENIAATRNRMRSDGKNAPLETVLPQRHGHEYVTMAPRAPGLRLRRRWAVPTLLSWL